MYVSSRTIECSSVAVPPWFTGEKSWKFWISFLPFESSGRFSFEILACFLLARASTRFSLLDASRGFRLLSWSLSELFTCALSWIPAYPWQLTCALRREILTILIVLITPSAVHLHAGVTVGLPPSPTLCMFLCIRYLRFNGLKCCMLLRLSYCEYFNSTSRNREICHTIFLWQVEGIVSQVKGVSCNCQMTHCVTNNHKSGPHDITHLKNWRKVNVPNSYDIMGISQN